MYTPWGKSDSQKTITKGIVSYTTSSHGGIYVEPSLNTQIHEAWRNKSGWYEEDCEWAIVAYTFQQHFDPKHVASAINTLKNWLPDEYEIVTGEKLTAEESHRRAEAEFLDANKDRYIVYAAFGDWHDKVPAGFVGVCAVIGGRMLNGNLASDDKKCFLVPADEYKNRTPFGFVVDVNKHQEIDAI